MQKALAIPTQGWSEWCTVEGPAGQLPRIYLVKGREPLDAMASGQLPQVSRQGLGVAGDVDHPLEGG